MVEEARILGNVGVMTIVDIREAKTQLSGLLERALAGEEIVIGKDGKPCARLVPFDPVPQRVLGRYRDRDGEVPDSVFAPLAQGDLAPWENEVWFRDEVFHSTASLTTAPEAKGPVSFRHRTT